MFGILLSILFVCVFLKGKIKMCSRVGVWYARFSSPRHPYLKCNPLYSQLISHASLKPHLNLVLEVVGSSLPPEHYCNKY